MDDSGEGRWTIKPRSTKRWRRRSSPRRSIARFRSRIEHSFGEKLLSAMRNEFGGHVESAPAHKARAPKTMSRFPQAAAAALRHRDFRRQWRSDQAADRARALQSGAHRHVAGAIRADRRGPQQEDQRGMAARAAAISWRRSWPRTTKSVGSRNAVAADRPRHDAFSPAISTDDDTYQPSARTACRRWTRSTTSAAMCCSTWRWPTASSAPSPASWARRGWSNRTADETRASAA